MYRFFVLKTDSEIKFIDADEISALDYNKEKKEVIVRYKNEQFLNMAQFSNINSVRFYTEGGLNSLN